MKYEYGGGPLEAEFKNGKIILMEGDITDQETEAIVNAANSSLMGGGGVDGAIHAAGGPGILGECKKIVARIGRLAPGEAVITTSGLMASEHVIHTVGPIWRGGDMDEPSVLASCYKRSLELALDHGIKSISFPSISTGAYGYPLREAAQVALSAVADFLEHNSGVGTVVFVLWGAKALSVYSQVLSDIQKEEGRS